MAEHVNRDFVICYYCPNEAAKSVTLRRGGEVTRRWVCSYHAETLPKKRRRHRWLRRVHALR